MANEHILFWEKKLVENQQILEMLNAGQFKAGDGGDMDERTLAEVRKWATRRVAECEARIAEELAKRRAYI
jgi:hypothetical protein